MFYRPQCVSLIACVLLFVMEIIIIVIIIITLTVYVRFAVNVSEQVAYTYLTALVPKMLAWRHKFCAPYVKHVILLCFSYLCSCCYRFCYCHVTYSHTYAYSHHHELKPVVVLKRECVSPKYWILKKLYGHPCSA